MRKTRFAAMAALCFCFAGCSLIKGAGRTLFVEPAVFSANKDSHRAHHRDRQWAEDAWNAEMAANPELCCSEEYKRGFEDGFADYLYAGGTGEPPPVPPRRLWNLDYRTPEGHKAVELWFAGFRRGAYAVREAGYRDFVTVKSSLLDCNHSDASGRPSGVPDDEKPFEVIPLPQPAEPVSNARNPTQPGLKTSSNTKKLASDREKMEPEPNESEAPKREAEPNLETATAPVDNIEPVKPVIKTWEVPGILPAVKDDAQTSTPATAGREHGEVVTLPPCPRELSP
jgi:hypothetical protein